MNQVIWITGASSGIGAELAKQYSKQGKLLILSARRDVELKAVKNSCDYPENIKILPLDLKDFDSMEKHVKKAITFFGSIDLLINNGGVSQRSLIAETNFHVYQELININYLGTVALTKALLPHFIEKEKATLLLLQVSWGNLGHLIDRVIVEQNMLFMDFSMFYAWNIKRIMWT